MLRFCGLILGTIHIQMATIATLPLTTHPHLAEPHILVCEACGKNVTYIYCYSRLVARKCDVGVQEIFGSNISAQSAPLGGSGDMFPQENF